MSVRRVDVNGIAGRAPAAGFDETWVMNPDARKGDPATRDGALSAKTSVREYLVTLPDAMNVLPGRLSAIRARGGPAVVMLCPGPAGHGFPLESWAVSPVPEFCEREELALAVDYGAAPFPWSEVVAFARAYPRLALLVLGAPLGGPTAMRALDATANIVLDTSAIGAHETNAVAAIARAGGAYRLAYGSGESRVSPSEIEATLRPEDAATVFSGTAAHLHAGTWASTFL
jgi:hypothetical protein